MIHDLLWYILTTFISFCAFKEVKPHNQAVFVLFLYQKSGNELLDMAHFQNACCLLNYSQHKSCMKQTGDLAVFICCHECTGGKCLHKPPLFVCQPLSPKEKGTWTVLSFLYPQSLFQCPVNVLHCQRNTSVKLGKLQCNIFIVMSHKPMEAPHVANNIYEIYNILMEKPKGHCQTNAQMREQIRYWGSLNHNHWVHKHMQCEGAIVQYSLPWAYIVCYIHMTHQLNEFWCSQWCKMAKTMGSTCYIMGWHMTKKDDEDLLFYSEYLLT